MGSAYTPLQRPDAERPQTYIDVIAEQKRVEEVSFFFILLSFFFLKKTQSNS